MVKYNRKDIKKNIAYVCITESLCCRAEINRNCKSTILQLKKNKWQVEKVENIGWI